MIRFDKVMKLLIDYWSGYSSLDPSTCDACRQLAEIMKRHLSDSTFRAMSKNPEENILSIKNALEHLYRFDVDARELISFLSNLGESKKPSTGTKKQHHLTIVGGDVMGDINSGVGAFHVNEAGVAVIGNYNNTPVMQSCKLNDSVDFKQLADELSKLRSEMKLRATNMKHDLAVGKVAEAEEAAKKGEKSKIFESLKSCGEWTLEIAEKIGLPIVIEVLKKAIDIK